MKGTQWSLGDGNLIDFKEDIWHEHEQLNKRQAFAPLQPIYESLYGKKVKDYWEVQEGEKKWTNFGEAPFNSVAKEQIDAIRKELNNIYILKFPKEDVLVWLESPSGAYIVTSGYLFLMAKKGITEHKLLGGVWKLDLLPKIIVFWWLCLKNNILIVDNLRKRGYLLVSRCSLCLQDGETLNHIFLHCTYTREVWAKLWGSFEVSWAHPKMVKDLEVV